MPTWARYQLLSDCFVKRSAPCAPLASCVGDLEGAVVDLVVVDAEGDEPDALGLLAGERVAGQQVVLRLRHAAEQRPADGGVVAGGDAEAGVAVDDARRASDDRHVGEQAGDETGADRGAVHGGHDRLRAVDDVEHEVARLAHDADAGVVVGQHAVDAGRSCRRR